MMIKFDDWNERLNAYLKEAQKNNVFAWGVNDCCTFTSGAVFAMTGIDLMKNIPAYGNDDEAVVVVSIITGGTLCDYLTEIFGAPLNGSYGRKGDIGFHDNSCGVIVGRYGLFFGPHDQGFVLVPITKIDLVFRVGI